MKVKVLVNLNHDGKDFKQDEIIEGGRLDALLPSLEILIAKKYIQMIEDLVKEDALELKEEFIDKKFKKKK